MIETDENGVIENIRGFLYNYYSNKVIWSKDSKKQAKYTNKKMKIWQNEEEFLKEMKDWRAYLDIGIKAQERKMKEREEGR